MVQITLIGRTFDVAPYKLKQLRQAAPYIEAVNAAAGSLQTLTGGFDVLEDMLGILAPGLLKVDTSLTLDALSDQVGIEDVADIQAAVMAVLRASGLAPGEAPAPSEVADPEAALQTSSATLSSFSSPQA